MAGNYRGGYQKKGNYQKKPTVQPGSQYKPLLTPSVEQNDIFEALLDTSDNLMLDAYAGCGKTSTCVEGMRKLSKKNPQLGQAYIIFAKRNQEEAVAKCGDIAACKTAHAFGLQAITAKYGKAIVDKNGKNERIAADLVGTDDEKSDLRFMFGKAMDLGKDYLATTPEEIETIVDKHGVDTYEMPMNEFCDKVLQGMGVAATQTNVLTFSDMTWLPIKLGLRISTFPIVFGDECQDLNKARQELIFRAVGDTGRLVTVGDKNQTLFGFSGADRFALENLVKRSSAKRFPLHLTFRCARAIVALAQQYVPDYQAAPTNSEGEVRNVSAKEMMSENGVANGDFILSRTNAPLMKYAMQLLIDGRRCNIQGKDLGANLLGMIKRSKAKDVSSFLDWVDDWAQVEIERLQSKKRDFEYIIDKQECFKVMCEGRRSLDEVKGYIKQLFDDKDDDHSRIILSNIHVAKGLERNRVFLLEKSFTVRPKTEEEIEAERNCRYVAFTRAKDSLFLVT